MSKKVLIIDIGNTATEFAVFENGNLQDFLGFFKLSSELENAKKALKSYKNKGFDIDDGMIFSVVPKNEEIVKTLVKEIFDKDISVFNWKDYTLKNKSAKIIEPIGADLLADIRQAEKEYRGPCLVVDFGTITKLLQLNEKGSFIGLSMIPGIETTLESYGNSTALLPSMNELKPLNGRLGINTVESIYHGAYWSTVYYVKEVLKSLNNKECKLIITGGNLRFIQNEFPEAIVDSLLTLKGMHLLYEEIVK